MLVVVGQAQPFSTIAFFHCSWVVRTCSLLRHTCEAMRSPLASSRKCQPSWLDTNRLRWAAT